MTIRSRLQKLARHMNAAHGGGPLTVVLTEASAERPAGRTERTNAAGLPVVEIAFDSTDGSVELPAPPYKLVAGIDPVDLV